MNAAAPDDNADRKNEDRAVNAGAPADHAEPLASALMRGETIT